MFTSILPTVYYNNFVHFTLTDTVNIYIFFIKVSYSVGAMSKGMFDRLFKFLVKKCNETLDTKQKRQHFIGVLDIAGFEIFDVS